VLAARCPYYNALWRQGWQESSQSVLDLDEISPAAFSQFLAYVYSEKFMVDGDSVVDVLKLSQRIQLSSLKALCERFILGSIDAENVCGLYQLGAELDSQVIINTCIKYIEKVRASASPQNIIFGKLAKIIFLWQNHCCFRIYIKHLTIII
jgi:hypothetical protein